MMSTRGTNRSPSDDSYENVSPRGSGGSPPGVLGDDLPPEEEIEFHPEEPDGPSPEDTDAPSDDDGEDEAEDETSVGSSVFSLNCDGLDMATLLDLTDSSRFCMVKMSRKVNGQVIPCVCGRVQGRCTRRGHVAKRDKGDQGTMGDPGFYEPLAEAKGVDGRLDRRWYSPEELDAHAARLQQDRETAARNLEASLGAAAEPTVGPRDPAVSFGGVTYHGGEPTPNADARGTAASAPGPTMNPRPNDHTNPGDRHSGPKPRSSVHPSDADTGTYDPSLTGPTLWYCFERPNTQRVATSDQSKMFLWQSQGATLVMVARTRKEAEEWVKAWRPPTTQSDDILGPTPTSAGPSMAGFGAPTAPIDLTGASQGATGGPRVYGHGTGAATARASSAHTPDPTARKAANILTDLLDKASRYATGPDPSVGTDMIFGVDPADTDRMDKLLLPPLVEDRETRQEFYDLAMDVANLPGGYRVTDDDDFGSTELLARAFGRSRSGYYRNWRKVTNNSLSRIKSQKELLQFVRDVEKSVSRHKAAQEQRMRSFLHACRLPSEVISIYLRSGLLPRVIQETYHFYKGLLETCRSAQWEMPGATWKDGYVDQMIQHHATELGQIRLTAADYRMHLLETYVYLRNANKEKYQDPTFTRSLLHSVAKAHGTGADDFEQSEADPGSTGGASRCKHCRRKDTHPGVDKEDCPLRMLSSRKAQAAVANLNKNQAKAIAKKLKELFENDPSGGADAHIATARSSV